MSRRTSRTGPRTRIRTAALGGLAVALLAGTAQLTAAPAGALPPGVAPDDPGTALWDPAAARLPDAGDLRPRVQPSDYRAYTLDRAGLEDLLARAPGEDARGAATNAVSISVPAPDGELVEFAVVESPVMEDGLAAANPDITTYAGRGVDDPTASIRLDVTPAGFHASVLGPDETAAWYVDPAFNDDDSRYLSYLVDDLPDPQQGLIEPPEAAELLEEDVERADAAAGEAPGEIVQRRTYRLALVTDPSYSTYFGPENVLAEKVTLMNRVNQIYNDDLAVRMVLIDGTEELAFDTLAEATEPGRACGPNPCYTEAQITQGCGGSLLGANRIALGQIVGASAYDIGHIALGINGGGIAGLGVVGGSRKGAGCTGLPQPEGDFMAVDYVAHEMGHQFGGPHTFNGTQLNCSGGNRSAGSSVEPGSGSSVMAYAGICRQDDLQPHTDPYFGQRSLSDITGTILAERSGINEVQQVSLAGYSRDGQSFRLRYAGQVTEPIVRGVTYNAAGIKAALDAILAPSSVTVTAYGSATSPTVGDTGFQVAFTGGPLAGIDVDLLDVVDPSVTVTGFAAETDRGGPQANGGDRVESFGNRAPAVDVPAGATIPIRTPFALTGEGTDADGDTLVYSWEQNDRGGATGTALVDQVKTNGPLFRIFGSYAPVTPAGTLQYDSPGLNKATGDPSRTFPDLDQVLANNTNAASGTCPTPPAPPATGGSNVPVELRECFAEWLPTADYTGDALAGNAEPSLNFRLTARDLDPQAGGTASGDVELVVDPTAGPFLVTGKNTEGTAAVGGRTENLTWAVAGTEDLAPTVTVSLSTDGGQTYPTVLAERVPNDGAQLVTWPDTPTEDGRIKIEAVGNYFFDVTNADLTILADPTPDPEPEAPETTIVDGPGRILDSDSASFTFGSDVAGATYSCTLDGEATTCDDGSLLLADLDAGTYEVAATATAPGGTADPTPVVARFTVPVDDRELTTARGTWRERAQDAAFLGTLSVSTSRRDTLVRPVSRVQRLVLLAQRSPGSGKVRVFLGRDRLRVVDLSGSAGTRVKITLARFTSPAAGRVRIVAAGERPVRIDALAVVEAP